ncbi:hypothetical protein AB1N83_012427 [Pleurotus pulmonarius]
MAGSTSTSRYSTCPSSRPDRSHRTASYIYTTTSNPAFTESTPASCGRSPYGPAVYRDYDDAQARRVQSGIRARIRRRHGLDESFVCVSVGAVLSSQLVRYDKKLTVVYRLVGKGTGSQLGACSASPTTSSSSSPVARRCRTVVLVKRGPFPSKAKQPEIEGSIRLGLVDQRIHTRLDLLNRPALGILPCLSLRDTARSSVPPRRSNTPGNERIEISFEPPCGFSKVSSRTREDLIARISGDCQRWSSGSSLLVDEVGVGVAHCVLSSTAVFPDRAWGKLGASPFGSVVRRVLHR